MAAVMEAFPQTLRSVPVSRKPPLEELSEVQVSLRRIEREFQGRGRIHVRYSGTEPVVRVMAEGEDPLRVRELVDEVCEKIRVAIGEETS